MNIHQPGRRSTTAFIICPVFSRSSLPANKLFMAEITKLIRLFFATSIILSLSSKALVHSICSIRDPPTLPINSPIPILHTKINTQAHSLPHTLRIRVYRSIINPHILSQFLALTVTVLPTYITPQVPTAPLYLGSFLPQVRKFCFRRSELTRALSLERLTRSTRRTRHNGGCPHAAKTVSAASLPYSTIELSSISRVIAEP